MYLMHLEHIVYQILDLMESNLYIDRNCDILSGYEDLETVFTLPNFPSFMGCVSNPSEQDILADMTFCISKSSGMIQLNPVLPLQVVYQKEHDSGTTGPAWLAHHQELADFIHRHSPNSIFEIGGSHGILNAEYCKKHGEVEWTILDSNPIPVSDCRATFVKGFYNSSTEIHHNVDMLVHSHCLEHFYYPREFFENTRSLVNGTKMCFSVPNLQAHFEKKFTNVMNFEHTYFCTESVIEHWLQSYNFQLLEKYYYKDDHSIFYAAEKVEHINGREFVNEYDYNQKLLSEWVTYHKNLVSEINEKISKTDQPVFLFGGHVFSQFLLAFGVDTSRIECILDNNVNKQDKRLYGTELVVKSPRVLQQYHRPLIILRSGVFNEEIKKDIHSNINADAEFLE